MCCETKAVPTIVLVRHHTHRGIQIKTRRKINIPLLTRFRSLLCDLFGFLNIDLPEKIVYCYNRIGEFCKIIIYLKTVLKHPFYDSHKATDIIDIL